MNKSAALVWLIPCFAIAGGAWTMTRAENPLVPVPERARAFLDPAEMLVRSAPADALRRLRDTATAEEAAKELNRYFGQYATNKSLVLHTTVEAAEPRPDVRNAFRIRAESAPVRWDGGMMQRLSWLYFQEGDAAAANSVKVGAEITVVGWVRKCEVVVTDDGPQLNFDVQYSRILSSTMPSKKGDIGGHHFSSAGLAGRWVWDAGEKIYPGTIDFESDGTGSHGARNNLTWKITGEREITIKHASRGRAVIRFDVAGETFAGTDYHGNAVKGRRFRR
jgi:hypothetical protein